MLRVSLQPVVWVLALSFSPAWAVCPQPAADSAQALVAMFVENQLTPASAGALLGTGYSASLQGRHWQVVAPACGLEIVFPVPADEQPLPEAQLRLRPPLKLLLHALQARFGPGETVYTSKASSVLFRLRPDPTGAILLYARLSTAAVRPDARVHTLVLRRVAAGP